MLTKVDAQWLDAVESFQIEDIMDEPNVNRFLNFIDETIEKAQEIIIRFLVEDIDDVENTIMVAYTWVVYNLDENKNIVSVSFYIPQDIHTYMAEPDVVVGRPYFSYNEPISLS